MESNELFLLAANSVFEPAQEEEHFDWLFSRGTQRLTGASSKHLQVLLSWPVNLLTHLKGRKLAALLAPPLPGLLCKEQRGRPGWEQPRGRGRIALSEQFLGREARGVALSAGLYGDGWGVGRTRGRGWGGAGEAEAAREPKLEPR